MCGRYSLTTPVEALRAIFLFTGAPNLAPRYNIAPTQPVPAVRPSDSGREIVLLRWGLIPRWAKDASIGARLINARAETVAEKPAFRDAFAKRRCLVLADGFYEWQKVDGRKQPWRITLKSGEPFAFAGLWEAWRDPAAGTERPVESCTILTTDANELLSAIHDRMPVILTGDASAAWLDTKGDAARPRQVLCPYPADRMQVERISTRINSVRNDDAACIAALPED